MASPRSAAASPSGEERGAKRQRLAGAAPIAGQAGASATEIFGAGDAANGRLFLGAQTATVEWRIENFTQQRLRADGGCVDGPTFGPREPWQVFCHPDGRCFNQPQGGPPGVFLRYLGPHERVPAYATIEKLCSGEFRVPENNCRDSPFVVLFGRNEIEEWGVCKDFGLFDDAFGRDLLEDTLVLRARVTWIEPRPDSLLPREVVSVRRNAASCLAGTEGSLQADLGALWNARMRPIGAGPSGGPAAFGGKASGAFSAAGAGSASTCSSASVKGGSAAYHAPPADLVLICEQQRFEVDRVVLATRSAFFGAMLATGQFREAAQKEVELPDVSARALAAALRFVYTDEGPEMRSREEAEELLTAASKLGIAGLLRLCSDCLRDTWLTMASAVTLLRLADNHGATSLRSEALAVLAANFDHVKTTPEWEDLLQCGMNPTLIQDTVQSVADASIYAGRASVKL